MMIRTLSLPLLFCTISSCLTAGVHRSYGAIEDRRKSGQVDCEAYAKGDPPEIGPFGLRIGLYFTAFAGDIYAMHALAATNPWYAVVYFALGYPQVAAERFPPFVSGAWCGSPTDPSKGPFDYMYIVDHRDDRVGCNLSEARETAIRQLILGETFSPDRTFAPFPGEFINLPTADKDICLLAYHLPGGEAKQKALRQP